jgi:cytoskeletal protein CcmA (bactofilin family)
MEDEDYFQFSDDLLLTTTEKLQFRDTAIYINSSADGQLDLVADTEIQIAATTIDINGAVALNGAITGATNITLSGELDAATLDISGNADIDGTLEADAITINGTAIGSIYSVVAGSSSIVTTGALDSGSITSGFGTIDTGSSTITTTGLITGGSLDIDNVLINGTTIGHTDDTDLMTLSSGVLTVAGEVDAVSLDISGDADIDGTLEADAITINGITLAETIADTVGAMVSSNTESNITVTYDDADNTLDFSVSSSLDTTGNAATATALETARTIHGVSFDGTANIDLSEVISDTVGAMVSSNTETGITVTYQDADNTIDFAIGSQAIVNSMLADDAVGADELAANAVVTASIVDDSITQAKIADDAVGADQLASDAVVNASIASGAAIADSKLATISTAGKVALTALEIDGGTDIGADLSTSDLIVVDDGAGGTNRKAALSRVVTLMSAQGFITDDPTALAIALG